MSTTEWDYYISYSWLDEEPEKDGIILRHNPSDDIAEGQVYVPAGEWVRSTTLLDIAFGDYYRDVIPVTEEKARQLMNQWVQAGRFPKPPDGWE